MDIFTDYANWKIEKYDLITTLKEVDSAIIKRYLNVLLVLDYLYEIVVDKKRKLSNDEEVIFNTGFEYLDNNFITIEELLKNNFNNNFKEMESCAKTINLYLYTLDFEDELLNLVPETDVTLMPDLKKLEDFEDEVSTYLNNKTNVDDAMFVKLDEITDRATGVIDDDELKELQESFLPWPGFDKEIRLRASQPGENDNLSIWRDQFRNVYSNQDDEFLNTIHPIFVSRMPKRSGTGQANKETVRSPKTRDNDGVNRTVRMRLTNVKLKDLENSATRDSDPELYEQLRERLLASNDDPKKAFEEPVYKSGKRIDKNGNPISPVSTIKVYANNPDNSGFYVNDGKAYVNNGSMIRLDVYKRINEKGKTEHFFVPVYAHQIKKGHPEYRPTKILPEPKKGPKEIDDSFEFVCNLHPNDYVMCYSDCEHVVRQGYYVKYNISDGGITLKEHESVGADDDRKFGLRNMQSIQCLDVGVLGDNYPWE